MKYIHKLLVTVFITGALFQSCETTDLDLIDNPNNITTGDPQFLLTSIQISYLDAQARLNDISSEVTRIDYMVGRNYFANYSSNTFNGSWRALYSSIIPDIQAIVAAETEDNPLGHNLGIAKILQAHLTMQLVDFLGDIVPLKEAGNPTEFPIPSPTNDGGAEIYGEALALLDEAIGLLNRNDSNASTVDLFYGNKTNGGGSDASKWIKLANTLKMRAALTTGDLGTFNNIASQNNFISDSDDDFEFTYGTLLAPVNTQHPDYQNDYTSAGANIYQNNWLVNQMIQNNDPRIRYYFTRQNDCTPGSSCNTAGNGETLFCTTETTPTHIQGTPTEAIWCHLENGYWGRMHGNDRGTPPDNFFRTAVGVYPAAGMFDDDTFRNVNLGNGGNGAGIQPFILASYVDFWRAEVALTQGQTANAATHMDNGLTKSIAKAQSFATLDAAADLGLEPTSGDVTSFIDTILLDFNAGSSNEQWNILSEQYWVTMYGGGADAHNYYRRTGFPTTLSLNNGPNPGNYPRTFLFPDAEVSANPNFQQRLNNDDAVFWNTQSLPIAN